MASSAVRISILANASQATKAFKQVSGDAERMGKQTSRAGSALKGALAFGAGLGGVAVLTSKFREAYTAVKLQGQLMSQTNAVIKSTGNAAGVSAKGVLALSDALEKKSLIDSEEIQKGQNILLTFTGIRNEVGKGNDVFSQATKTAVDMSTALGQDMKSSSIQLGKALNDPIKGVTALSKVGVSFTEKQKGTIKSLTESGDKLGAQKLILAELKKEFGGSAAAAGKTAAGQFKHFKDVVDTVFENIVKKAIPILLNIIDFLQDKVPKAIDAVRPYTEKLSAAFDVVKQRLEPVLDFLKKNPETVKAFALTLGILAVAIGVVSGVTAAYNAVLAANPIGIIIILIAALVAGLVYAYKHSEKFRAVVDTAMAGIRAAFTFMWNNVVSKILKLLLTGFIAVTKIYAALLRGLSKVPGFGWAKKAANGMDAAANGAKKLRDKIGEIPKNPKIKVTADTASANSKLINTKKYLDAIKSKKVTLTVAGGNDLAKGNRTAARTSDQRLATASSASRSSTTYVEINVNVSPGTSPEQAGREVDKVLRAYYASVGAA